MISSDLQTSKLRSLDRKARGFLKAGGWYAHTVYATLRAMKTVLKALTLATVLAFPVASAQESGNTTTAGTTTSGTPLVEDKANPSNRDPGTDWGWLGLAGLLGLGGLAGRRYADTTSHGAVPVDSLRVEEAQGTKRP